MIARHRKNLFLTLKFLHCLLKITKLSSAKNSNICYLKITLKFTLHTDLNKT